LWSHKCGVLLAAAQRSALPEGARSGFPRLPTAGRGLNLGHMFIVTEADADAIRDIFHREGELSAAIEVRRRFPLIPDNKAARLHARTIAGWTPSPAAPSQVTWLHPELG
jgi:hypothetical protein